MHPLLKTISWLLFVYVSYCGLLFVMQRQILFPRYAIPKPPHSDPKNVGLEKIQLDVGFGMVQAWYIPPAAGQTTAPFPAVIFGHGNGELIDLWPDTLEGFARLGIALMLVEYPGYGSSAGSPSQDSITQIFVAAYDNLTSRKDIDSSRIVFFGRSLGGGAVCALAQKRSAAGLILMSTFTGVRSFAKRYLVPSFLVRDPFDNLSVIKNYPRPVLIIHGQHDEVIPFSHGKALYKASQKGKMIPYDAGHNDCPPDWKVFWQDLASFLREIGII
jgi:pimeloyl-ACP methyl ester carboxylesterase